MRGDEREARRKEELERRKNKVAGRRGKKEYRVKGQDK